MTIDVMTSEAAVWIVAICSAAGGAAGILWIAMQILIVSKGCPPCLRINRANIRECGRLLSATDDVRHRQIRILVFRSFCICMVVLTIGVVLILAMFFASVLSIPGTANGK